MCLLKYCSYRVRRGGGGTCGGVRGGRGGGGGGGCKGLGIQSIILLTSGNPLTNPFPPPTHS